MKKVFLVALAMIVVSGLILSGCAAPPPEEKAPPVAPPTAPEEVAPPPPPPPEEEEEVAPLPPPPPPPPPIKIGVLYPLTGGMAMTGEKMVRGAKLGYKEAGYEVAGRKIEIIVEDSGGTAEMAVDKAKKLVEHDKVCMIQGPLVGPTKMAVGDYMSKVGVPHLTTGPAPWPLTMMPWCFLVGGTEPQHSSVMGRYAYDELGYRTVTVITGDWVPGHGFLNAFMGAFKERGGEVIQEQYTPVHPCMDFGAYLVALKDADAVVAWFDGADGIRFLSQFHEFGIRKRMPLLAAFHGSFFCSFILREIPPEAAEAVIGEYVPTPFTPLLETDASKRFVDAFSKQYGYKPTDETEAGAYAGALAAVAALKATGGDTTPEKIREAILALEFEAPEGLITFDRETKAGIKNQYICRVEKIGEEYMWDPVYTYEEVPPQGLGPPPGPPPGGPPPGH